MRRAGQWQSLAASIGLVVALAMAGPAFGSSIYDHRTVARRALTEMGWRQEGDIDRVITCNMATDFGRLNAFSRTLSRVLYPGSGFQINGVRAMARTAPFSSEGTLGFHFNSLYSYSAIETRWRDLGGWADHVSDSIGAGTMPPELEHETYLRLVGMVSHAVQDFYAHANWVGLLDHDTPGEMKADEFPLWEELVQDHGGWRERHPEFHFAAALDRLRISDRERSATEDHGGLQTGRTGGEHISGVQPWMHRHKGGEEKAVVSDLARRAIILWIQRIDQRLEQARQRAQGKK